MNAVVIPSDAADFDLPPLDTTSAATESCGGGEPIESCPRGVTNSNSVYFSFKPRCKGEIDVNTFGSDYDTVLSIFDGCARLIATCTLPTEQACNDDAGSSVQQSQLMAVPVAKDATYIIKVSGKGLNSGGGILRLRLRWSRDTTQGKLSRNVYRIPYADGTSVKIGANSTYFEHCGGMDMNGVGTAGKVCSDNVTMPCGRDADCANGTCEYVIVAAADGIVCTVLQHFDDCGSPFGKANNMIRILHANGEMSHYLHLKQWSPASYGIDLDMFVTAGQPIGLEGDVGRTVGGDGGSCPRVGTCFATVPADTPNCGSHLHWAVKRYTTGEFVNPFTCGISVDRNLHRNIYQSGKTYEAPCAPQSIYDTNAIFSNSLTGYESTEVVQAFNSIIADRVIIKNRASVVLHAGNKITLAPGFRVKPSAYFRAEIESPDVTAPSTWLAPSECRCDQPWIYCYEATDMLDADQIFQGCGDGNEGPNKIECRGCFPGSKNCCPCANVTAPQMHTCQASGSCSG